MLPVPCVQTCPLGFCIATLLGDVISLGITMISSSHHSQCSINSHSVFSIYLIAKIFLNFYLLIWLCQVLVVACRIFGCSLWAISYSMWDPVPCLEIKPKSPASGTQSLNHRILTTGPPGKSLNNFMDKFSYPYSRVFPCSGSLLILESLPMGQTRIFRLFMTALSSLESSQHLSQLHYSFTPQGRRRGLNFFPF